MAFNQETHDALRLIDGRDYWKPFRYSELYNLAETHRKMNWTIEEVRKLRDDIKDWKELDADEKAVSKIENANKSTKQYSQQTLQAYEYVLELEQRRDGKIREIEAEAKTKIEKAKAANKQNLVGAERALANQRDSVAIVSQTEKQLQKAEKAFNADLTVARARHQKLENVDIANNANSHKSIVELEKSNINRLSYVSGLLGSLAFWASIISAFCAVYCYAIADTLGMSVEQIIEKK